MEQDIQEQISGGAEHTSDDADDTGIVDNAEPAEWGCAGREVRQAAPLFSFLLPYFPQSYLLFCHLGLFNVPCQVHVVFAGTPCLLRKGT